ncbi:Hypothetical predicted protein [Pelobates cultripes]|uniref:HEPN domain-containing protein n=1 Tax=Pelobates cultripes TaxID=61616 RepID=A0AAD1WRU2_PELCU|nr:Hypothetical predicted protein [Pelobates cultripes]
MSKEKNKVMDFFQRAPPFLVQLQNILRKYPDGGQILKELIQNADDARASEVIFIYDERQYGNESLYSKDLQSIQGPALLAYNNEMFTDGDWEGIQKPGNSLKRKDPNTVGRFGLGFNSVYHITDYPAIFSGKNIGILDPCETVFHRGGCSWNLGQNKESIEELADQFHPFQTVLEAIDRGSWSEILKSGCFKGTLFRFPFRLAPSEISENVYSSERVQELFESFIRDACISLLFLRHVTSVSLKRIGSDGVLTNLLTVNASSESSDETETPELKTGTHVKITTVKQFDIEKEEFKWLMTTCSVHGYLFADLEELSKKLYNNIALDLAFPLTKGGIDLFGGRLSCVLPLPDKDENRTGLPLIINGCFDLTDDRRSIKWIEVDQQHDDAAKWNHILVERLLPLVYKCAIMHAVSLAKTSKITVEEAYSIWPDPVKTQHKGKWHNITKELAKLLINERLLQTADKSCWVATNEAIFMFIDNDGMQKCLEDLLLLLKKPLVKIPGHVYRTLTLSEISHAKLNIVSPLFIRTVMHNSNWSAFPNEKKMLLLTYVISDGQFNDLLNLQLLPLSDGTFISFQNNVSSGMAYIDSPNFPRTLLPGLVKRFIPEDLPSDLLSHLRNIGLKRTYKNLMCLDEVVVCRSLSEALPKTWLKRHDIVTWCPGEPNNPPLNWLPTFWAFLQRYDYILESLEDQPLVPLNSITQNTNDIKLAPLKKNTTLVFQKKDGYILNDCLTAMLEQAGCSVIQQENSWLWHKNIQKYILVPSPNNILEIFSHLNLKELVRLFLNSSREDAKMFCDYISQARSFTASELKILYQLPIFCSTNNIHFSDSRLVNAGHLRAVDKTTTPTVPEDLVFPDVFICCRGGSDRRLLQLMKIPLLNASDVALVFVKAIQSGSYAHYQNKAQDAMLWILRNGHIVFTQNDVLRRMCASLNFIPQNGKVTQASLLFDPKVQIFQELFEPENFPPPPYNEDLILKSLRTLGLKDSLDNIKPDDVLQIAKTISQLKCHTTAKKKAEALIKVCNTSNILSKLNKPDLKTLCGTSWVPVDVNKFTDVFSEPKQSRDMMYSNIVEFSMPLTNDFNKQASSILGLSDLPPPGKVLENLKSFSQNINQIDQFSFYRKLHDIYKYIKDHVEQFYDDLHHVLIWNGEGFSYPQNIVLSYPDGLDLSTYVKKVPSDFLIYKSLFIQCGVHSSLPEDKVINILHVLNHSIETRIPPSGDNKELRLAVSILDWMKTNNVHGSDDLPIPVQTGKCGFCLKPLSTTLFCDIDKLRINGLCPEGTNYYIVHEEVSPATVRFLNIPLLSTKLLQPEYFELAGPSEPITLRIKNILREYSEHVELFKEIIQNADDANSTVCEFLVDMRQNSESRQSLIDADMAMCHGPALWCYNNSKFTENDFVNITRVGGATKETQLNKIGKFGLGFNTVYHITDVPSIMSGSKLLIFDPNINHMKKHIPNGSNPGIKLNLQKNPETLKIFADQFQPFSKVFSCDLKSPFHFDGTLIRLPFRTETEAKISQICEHVYNEENINIFLNSFESSADILLIFLKNVERVTLNFLPKDLHPEKKTTRMDLHRDRIKRLEVPESVFPQQKRITASNILGVSTDEYDVTGSNIIKLTVQQLEATKEQHYLVQSSLGIKGSLQMFTENPKTKFSLPIAGVALPLKKNHETGRWSPDLLDFKGVAFCFLPLPIFSGLPFHLNGSFSVMSNRKSLWDTTEKGEWNKRLCCDAVLVALITALLQLQEQSLNGALENYQYHTFWPDITKVKSQFTEAVKAFYQAMAFGFADYLPALFSNGQESCTIKHACFLQLENTSSNGSNSETIQKLATKVFSQFLPKPYLAVSIPEWVKTSFINSNCFTELHNNYFNCERFYRDIVFENLDSLDTEDRNALIRNAIDMQNKQLNELLLSKPCIPTSPNGKLQFITKLVHPEGLVSTLYNQEDECFPQGADFLKTDRLARLQFLGMVKDKIPMKELMERAAKINEVWKQDRNAGLQKMSCVLELINDLCHQSKDNISQREFRSIAFLPALSPKSIFDGTIKTDLMKSTDIFHSKYKDLVCMIKPVLWEDDLGELFTFSQSTLSFLGLDQPPNWELVISQLTEIHKISNLLKTEEMSQMVRSCYSFLNKFIQKGPSQAKRIRERTEGIPFVYVNRDFVPLDSLAFEMPFDASPYLYKLPNEYKVFHNLWDCVGLREKFTIKHYTTVFENMAMKYKNSPLPQKETSLAIQIINHFAIYEEDSIHSLNLCAQQIFIPDQQCIMCHRDKIYFNDTPWLLSDKSLRFCHDLIPRSVALKLGIKTKIHHTLQKMKVSNLSHWVLQFGAKEEITTRIKNIIGEYSSKKDILKELIQNADDSEATEIHFVLDNRTHKTTKSFGESWKPLQGPSLCIYNNKTFDSKDIEGIQMLGIGGKGDRVDKTGKFGLGFNTVYHITDCPSFVTEDFFLCVFDPNLAFLPTSETSSPGGMFKLDQEFKNTFEDVYHTYLPELFNLQEGTLFRLPLRMANTVEKSKICNQTVSLEDIRIMCKELEEDADSMILFLNHIKKITFSEISCIGDNKKLLSITTEMEPLDENGRSAFQHKISQLAEDDKFEIGTEPLSVSYKMVIKCNSKKPKHWLIDKQVGIEGDKALAEFHRISKLLQKTIAPHGAIATCLDQRVKGRAFCTLPLPAETGLPVHISGTFVVDAARRDICEEDGRSLKTEWNSFILSNVIAPLYVKHLKSLKKEITSGRETIIFKSWNSCRDPLDNFLSHFPKSIAGMSQLWKTMVNQVYRTIFEKQVKLVPVYKTQSKQNKYNESVSVEIRWTKIDLSLLIEAPYFLQREKYEDNLLVPVLQAVNMKLAYDNSQYSICEEFKEAGVEVLELSPKTLCNFLRNVPLHSQEKSQPLKVSETFLKKNENCKLLLKYCFIGQNSNQSENVDLQGVPLLVTEDDMLQSFDRENPKYYSKFSNLFPAYKHLFTKCEGACIDTLEKHCFLKPLTIQNAAFFIKAHLGESYNISPTEDCAGQFVREINNEPWLKHLWCFFQSELHSKRNEERMQLFKGILSLFNDWAILPVCYGKHSKKNVLIPLAKLKNTLRSFDDGEVTKSLFELGFSRVKSSLLPSDLYVEYIYPALMETKDVSIVLQQLCSKSHLQWNELEAISFEILLNFFLHGLQNKSNSKTLTDQLQSLPLFENHKGMRKCLNIYEKIYILDTNRELEFIKLYELDPQTIFLKNNATNRNLCKHINIQIIKEVDFLVEFLLHNLASVHEEEFLHILKLILEISHLPEYQNKKDTVISTLKPIKLIRDKNGALQQVSYFYNHEIPIFNIFEFQSMFIPEDFMKPFKKYGNCFNTLLLDLGMKNALSENDFIRFATNIERDAKDNDRSKSLKPKAKALFNYLLSMGEKNLRNDFITKLGNIKFLFPLDVHKDLKSLFPSHSENTTIALKGSLLKKCEEYESLTWTSMDLIKNRTYLDKKKLSILEKCGVLLEPPICHVVNNLKNICSASCDNKTLKTTRSQVLKLSYNFLQNKNTFDPHTFADIRLILLEDNNVTEPGNVVFNLYNEDHFSPYLFKLPPLLACYSPFFQKIGVALEPSTFHYAKVLSTIYKETLYKEEMHPNLKRTVLTVTEQLFKLLEKEKPTELPDIKTLYLPATNGKLYDSCSLVLNNRCTSMAISRQSNVLKFLAIDYLSDDLCKQEQLVKCLPEQMRPKMLTQITEQTVDKESLKICKYGVQCPLKKRFQELVASPVLHEGLVCLLRSQNNGKLSEEEASKMCRVVSGKLEVKCCSNLKTSLMYHGKPLEGTHMTQIVFVNKNSEDQCTIYLKHTESVCISPYVIIITVLAAEINSLMEHEFNSQSMPILIQMLSCENPDGIIYVLKTNNLWKKKSAYSIYRFPNPGEPIPAEWHDALDMSILNSFKVNDYVGYMDPSEEGSYRYATIVEELDTVLSNGEIKMYRICLGKDEFAEVSALDLYQFKRIITEDCKALVLVENTSQQEHIRDKWHEASMEHIKKEIDGCLEQIWNLPKNEREKAIRRLYLKYHPDKNTGQEELSTEICKYLQQRIRERESGTKANGAASSTYSNPSRPFYKCWERWDREASYHRRSHETFSKSTKCQYDFWGYHNRATKPNPTEASRWFRQAECDLRAAEHEVGLHHTEWVFFKVHQAVEKALFAAQYIHKGKTDINENIDIVNLAKNVSTYCSSLHDINKHVLQMERYGVDKLKTQYPNFCNPPGIPNNSMPSDKEHEAIKLAENVLQKIKTYVY